MDITVVNNKEIDFSICLKSEVEFLHLMWRKYFSNFEVLTNMEDPYYNNCDNNSVIVSRLDDDKYFIKNIGLLIEDIELVLGLTYEIAFDIYRNHLTKYYLLHGAALKKNKKTYLFIGPSSCGKSSFCTFLCARGYEYLSDDVIPLNDKFEAFSFPKPIHIRDAEFVNNHVTVKDRFDELNFRMKLYNNKNELEEKILLKPLFTINTTNEDKCYIDTIFLLNRVDKLDKSTITAIGKSQAFYNLISNLLTVKDLKHIKYYLARLVDEVPVFRFDYKNGIGYVDVFEEFVFT